MLLLSTVPGNTGHDPDDRILVVLLCKKDVYQMHGIVLMLC